LEVELLRSNAVKDEELKTERKQNEEKISATNEGFEKQIKNLQVKYDECKGREKKLETENKELKDENKKINNELKEHKKGNNMVKYENISTLPKSLKRY
jgi:chromosome segregation ATPase